MAVDAEPKGPYTLPPPRTEAWDWQLYGSCRRRPDDLFFAPADEFGAARNQRRSRAKLLCDECPVRPQCLDYALTAGEPYGIWGGLTPTERRRVDNEVVGVPPPRAHTDPVLDRSMT